MDSHNQTTIARFLRSCLLDSQPEPLRIEAAWMSHRRGPRRTSGRTPSRRALLGEASRAPGAPYMMLVLRNRYQATLTGISLWCMALVPGGVQALRLQPRCEIRPGQRILLGARLPARLHRDYCREIQGLQVEDAMFTDDTLWVAGTGGGCYSGTVTWRGPGTGPRRRRPLAAPLLEPEGR